MTNPPPVPPDQITPFPTSCGIPEITKEPHMSTLVTILVIVLIVVLILALAGRV